VDAITSERLQRHVEMNFFSGKKGRLVGFYRTIWTDILGITLEYGKYDTGDFLEASVFYCGIFTFLLAYACVISMEGKIRIVTSVAYDFVAIYMLVTPVHYILNGMSGLT